MVAPRWVPIALIPVVVFAGWWSLGGVTEETKEPAATELRPPVVTNVRPRSEAQPDEERETDRIRLPSRGERALARIDQREAEVPAKIAALVESGEITEEEGKQLLRAAAMTIDDARSIVNRVQSGEIYWFGGVIRSIPLRIRHATYVVNIVGYDRARGLGEDAE